MQYWIFPGMVEAKLAFAVPSGPITTRARDVVSPLFTDAPQSALPADQTPCRVLDRVSHRILASLIHTARLSPEGPTASDAVFVGSLVGAVVASCNGGVRTAMAPPGASSREC